MMIRFLNLVKVRNIKFYSIIVFLIFVSLYGMKALFHSGFYTSHDGWHQVARLYHFNKALFDGQFPPRWSGDLLNGFGYPIFIFSYHLPWLLAEPFMILKFDIFTSIKIVFIISFIFSGIFMFLWINSMWGKKAGLIAAFLYLWTPYRFVNILVRANIGESLSYLFLPLLYWSLFKLRKNSSILAVILGGISLTGLILSHAMIVFLFGIPIILYFLICLRDGKKKLKYFLTVLASFILGLGLSSYYLIPATYYRSITVFQERFHDLYQNHFTPFSKLVYSSWGYGAIGTAGEMSRQIGISIWLSAIFSLILLIYLILFKKKNIFRLQIMTSFIFILSFIFATFMMLKESLVMWKIIEPFTLVDFPWRFLSLTTFAGSVLSGFMMSMLKGKLQVMIALILLGLALYSNRNHLRVNQYTNIPLSLYLASELTTNTDDEYLPKWVDRSYAKDEKIALIPREQINIENLIKTSNSTMISYSSASQQSIDIHQMYFPGVTAFLDNEILRVDKNDKGGIKINLSEGKHSLKIIYLPTLLMRISTIITLISVVIILFLLSKKFYFKT